MTEISSHHSKQLILSYLAKTMLTLNPQIQLQKQFPVSSSHDPQQIQLDLVQSTDQRQEDMPISDTMEMNKKYSEFPTNKFVPNTDIKNIFSSDNDTSDMYGKDYIFDLSGYQCGYELPFLKDSKTPCKNIKTVEIEPFSGFDPLFKDEQQKDDVVVFYENLGRRLEENIARVSMKSEPTTPEVNFNRQPFVDNSESTLSSIPNICGRENIDNENINNENIGNESTDVSTEVTVTSDITELKELKEEIFKVEKIILELDNMSSPAPQIEKNDVTNEVFTTNEIKYLIKRNGVEYAFADELKIAISVVNSIANAEIKRLTTDKMHVFLRADRNDCRVQIYTQSIGIVLNGTVCKNTVYEIFPVKRIFYVHQDPVGFSKEDAKKFIPEKV
jgi:hypothetical protein